MGTMFRFTKGDETRVFWVLPNGKAVEYTVTGRKEETNFVTINDSLKRNGFIGKII